MTIYVQDDSTSILAHSSEYDWGEKNGTYHLGFTCLHDRAYVDKDGNIECPGCLDGQGMSDDDILMVLSTAEDGEDRFMPYGE